MPRRVLLAAAVLVIAGSAPAASSRVGAVPRTLVVTSRPIASFAQDGRELAWVTRDRERPCRRVLHFRRVEGGPTASLRIGCHLMPGLALAGRTALWKTLVGGGNLEADFDVKTATAGAKRPLAVERLQMSLDIDSGLPNGDPPLAGASSLLAYYAEDIQALEQEVRRVTRGASRTLFTFPRALSLAVGGGRVAVVRQELGGDGCGCVASGAWSPDGSKVAFLQGPINANSVEEAGVAVMNADGSGRALITQDALIRLDTGASRSRVAWSPDGGRIAYSYLKNGGWEIAVVRSDGTDAHDLAPGQEPAWSRDGSTIAFSRSLAGGAGIYLMNADGSSVRQVTSSGEAPTWSPDGTRLAYTDGGALYVVNADGTGLHALVSTGPYAHVPAWSPDGARIAFGGQGVFNGSKGGIWVVNADGTNLHQLTTEADDDPSWPPDGGHILFTSARDDVTHVERLQLELFTMKSDGSEIHPLTFTQPAEWAGVGELRSSSGRRLATFRAAGAPARWSTFGSMSESRAVAVGGGRVAVLSVLARTGEAEISVFDASTGAFRHAVEVPAGGPLELAGLSGKWVVFRTGRTVRLLDAGTLQLSTLAQFGSDPIGLSVSGRRVAWAEKSGAVGRIRALTLPN